MESDVLAFENFLGKEGVLKDDITLNTTDWTGQFKVHDEVVLSLSKINNSFSFDDTMGILKCDAGFILEDLDNKLASLGYMVPFDLGAKGSCQIGGNIATCAGGIRLIRYGSLHAHLLGLTVVLPDEHGTVLHLGSDIRKDNTSLHTPHLFLGSEGQLGVITSVTMTAVPRPKSVQSAMLGGFLTSNIIKIVTCRLIYKPRRAGRNVIGNALR
uniref:FAD-binding PCMH-type domain-containing protein n=2 Tax=Caenorhabditis japonica TaxID=281687 RepID=A0A8R1EQ26_CAEJA